MSNLILSAETVLPISDGPLNDSAVAISGGKILELGNTRSISKKYRNFKHVRLGKGILMPGFINAHIHLEFIRNYNIRDFRVPPIEFPSTITGSIPYTF